MIPLSSFAKLAFTFAPFAFKAFAFLSVIPAGNLLFGVAQ